MRSPASPSSIGQGLLEFALVLPLLLLVILGTFDFGYLVLTNNMLENAAREGARKGIIKSNTDADIRLRVRNTAPTLALTDEQISISPSPDRKFGDPITITVQYVYVPLTPVVGTLTRGGIRLSATSVMIVEKAIRIER